jgi:hypothetical protein
MTVWPSCCFRLAMVAGTGMVFVLVVVTDVSVMMRLES